jgi:hypothetical protein
MRSHELGSVEVRRCEVCPFEMSPLQVGHSEIRPSEKRSLKVGSHQVGSLEMRVIQVRPFEMRFPKIGPLEKCSIKNSTPEIAFAQVKFPPISLVPQTDDRTEHARYVTCWSVIWLSYALLPVHTLPNKSRKYFDYCQTFLCALMRDAL